MTTKPTDRTRLRRRNTKITIATVVIIAVIAAILMRTRGSDDNSDLPTFEVRKGPLTISLNIAGTVRATEQVIIKSQVEGQATLIYVIAEGTLVKEGELLVQLDASKLEDSLLEQQIQVKNAEAAFIRAREGLAVTRNQTQSDISLAELNSRFAKEDLQQYTEGSYKQQLLAAESKVTLAEEELQLAQKKLEWSEKLYGEDYISQADRDSDRLACNRARLGLELAIEDKKLLENFTYHRELAKLTSDVTQTDRALERARLKALADVVQAEADLDAKESGLKQQKTKMEKARDQISKTKITAPSAGLVVYATSAQFSWRGKAEPLEAGQSIRERQELIHLPTADEMKLTVEVHESNLDLVRLGLPAVITIDSLKDQRFVGIISKIAPLPNAASMWMNPDLKVYTTEILIEGKNPQIRTGVSAMAEIIVDRYEDAIYVPVQAVVRVGGKPTVFIQTEKEPVPRQIEVGRDNNRMIHVLANLQPGEHVLMTPPLSDTGMPDETQPGGLSDATVKDLAKRARKAPEASATPQQPGSTKPRKKPRTEGAARRGNPPGAKP